MDAAAWFMLLADGGAYTVFEGDRPDSLSVAEARIGGTGVMLALKFGLGW